MVYLAASGKKHFGFELMEHTVHFFKYKVYDLENKDVSHKKPKEIAKVIEEDMVRLINDKFLIQSISLEVDELLVFGVCKVKK